MKRKFHSALYFSLTLQIETVHIRIRTALSSNRDFNGRSVRIMRRSSLSFLLIVTLLFSCLSLSGCGKVDGEYRAFYDSLVNQDGAFRFRGMEPGAGRKEILQAEGIDGTEGRELTHQDSTGLFRCLVPVQFPCFSFDWYRDYKTAPHTPSRDGGKSDGFLISGSYTAFFEPEEDFPAACRQVTAFLKTHFPKGTSWEALEQIPEPEQRILSPQWQMESKDGSALLVTFQNKVSPKNPARSPAFGSIRIEVSYHKLAPPLTEDKQAFYHSLVDAEGNFRFCGTEPGQTYEELRASCEKEGEGKEVLTPLDSWISCTVPDSFPCFAFSLSKKYQMKEYAENGTNEWKVQNALAGGFYTAYFYREEDWAEACRQMLSFLQTAFPQGKSLEALAQLPEPGVLMSPQWKIEGNDGSSLSVVFQNRDLDHPLNKSPSACSLSLVLRYPI